MNFVRVKNRRVALTVVSLVVGFVGACGGGTEIRGTGDVQQLGVSSLMATPVPDSSNTPSLVVAADGTAWMSWTERRADSSVALRVASYRNGQWAPARTAGEGRSFFVNWADFPVVTVLKDGGLAAHWLEREGTGKYAYGIRVVQSGDSGKTWSAPVTPHTDRLEAEHGFVALWPDSDGGVGAVWLDGRKSAMPDSAREMTVRTAVVAPDGSLSKEAVLDTRSCDCCQISSAATATGRIIVYRDRTNEEIRDIVAVRSEGAGWSAPSVIHADNWHIKGCPVNGPSIVARGDTVMVAWFTAARDTAKVQVAMSTDGGANFGTPVRVDDGDPLGRVSMVLDQAGDMVVGWMERTSNETADVRVRRIAPPGSSVLPAIVVGTTSAARQSGFPRLAVVGDTLLVAWTAATPVLKVQLASLPLNSRSKR